MLMLVCMGSRMFVCVRRAISTAVDVTVVPNTVPNAGAYAERLVSVCRSAVASSY